MSVLVKEMEDDKDLPLDADSYLALMDGSRHANNLSRLQRYANKMRDAVRANNTQTDQCTEEGEGLGCLPRAEVWRSFCVCAGPVVWVGSLL